MATTIAQQQVAVPAANRLPGRRFDHLFFPAVAWLMLVIVFVGFAGSYYLVRGIQSPNTSLAIHVHAALFSAWILLLIVQTSLTAAGRVDVHRRLGIAGFILAGLMLIVGIWAATDTLARGLLPGDPLAFYIGPIGRVVVFAVLMVFAYRARFDSAAHKRLIIVASTALMTAPIARWHFHNFLRGREIGIRGAAEELSFLFILLLIAYDLWATRRVHRATVWAGAFLILFQQLTHLIVRTHVWHVFAGWVQTMARS